MDVDDNLSADSSSQRRNKRKLTEEIVAATDAVSLPAVVRGEDSMDIDTNHVEEATPNHISKKPKLAENSHVAIPTFQNASSLHNPSLPQLFIATENIRLFSGLTRASTIELKHSVPYEAPTGSISIKNVKELVCHKYGTPDSRPPTFRQTGVRTFSAITIRLLLFLVRLAHQRRFNGGLRRFRYLRGTASLHGMV